MNQAFATILVALVALTGSGFATVLSYRASGRANAIQEKKLDTEAYDRATGFYDRLLATADRELERLRGQVDRLYDQLQRVNTQLAQEADVSNVLRNQVRALQTQVESMETTMVALRGVVPTASANAARREKEKENGH